jgi:hypothetical protein
MIVIDRDTTLSIGSMLVIHPSLHIAIRFAAARERRAGC